MAGLEVIDFGAIGYKEIFQNVKTILATPLYSAALERTLGIDQTIVDLPINEANLKVIAILTAITQWEPRCQVMNIDFTADPLQGHMQPIIQLKINNVIYGTNESYTAKSIGAPPPERVKQDLPPMNIPVPGPPGEKGTRGSLWFVGTTDPPIDIGISGGPVPQEQDCYLNTTNGDVWQFNGGVWRKVGGK
jgi:phage baseplate assembly protein W